MKQSKLKNPIRLNFYFHMSKNSIFSVVINGTWETINERLHSLAKNEKNRVINNVCPNGCTMTSKSLELTFFQKKFLYSAGPFGTTPLCVIFKILVSFLRNKCTVCLKGQAKINVVWNFFKRSNPEGAARLWKNIDF